MEKEYRYREPKSVKEAWKRLKHRIVPAILAGLALALLVFLLQYFDIDKAYGLGTSAVIFTSFASSIYIMFITPNSRAAKNSKFVKILEKEYEKGKCQACEYRRHYPVL